MLISEEASSFLNDECVRLLPVPIETFPEEDILSADRHHPCMDLILSFRSDTWRRSSLVEINGDREVVLLTPIGIQTKTQQKTTDKNGVILTILEKISMKRWGGTMTTLTPQFRAKNAFVYVHISVRSVFPTTECRSIIADQTDTSCCFAWCVQQSSGTKWLNEGENRMIHSIFVLKETDQSILCIVCDRCKPTWPKIFTRRVQCSSRISKNSFHHCLA